MPAYAGSATINVPRKRRHRINTEEGVKWCPQCSRHRETAEFGASIDRYDGLNGWCRGCRAKAEKGRRDADLEASRATSRARYAENPVKWKAKVAVERAVSAGRLVKPDACPVCGRKRRVEAHHHRGYARENWLEIVWRCRPCHALEHTRGQQNEEASLAHAS
jgi:hypothetical protein